MTKAIVAPLAPLTTGVRAKRSWSTGRRRRSVTYADRLLSRAAPRCSLSSRARASTATITSCRPPASRANRQSPSSRPRSAPTAACTGGGHYGDRARHCPLRRFPHLSEPPAPRPPSDDRKSSRPAVLYARRHARVNMPRGIARPPSDGVPTGSELRSRRPRTRATGRCRG
jgi:hypothetical protein